MSEHRITADGSALSRRGFLALGGALLVTACADIDPDSRNRSSYRDPTNLEGAEPLLPTGPTPEQLARMSYDAVRNRVIQEMQSIGYAIGTSGLTSNETTQWGSVGDKGGEVTVNAFLGNQAAIDQLRGRPNDDFQMWLAVSEEEGAIFGQHGYGRAGRQGAWFAMDMGPGNPGLEALGAGRPYAHEILSSLTNPVWLGFRELSSGFVDMRAVDDAAVLPGAVRPAFGANYSGIEIDGNDWTVPTPVSYENVRQKLTLLPPIAEL